MSSNTLDILTLLTNASEPSLRRALLHNRSLDGLLGLSVKGLLELGFDPKSAERVNSPDTSKAKRELDLSEKSGAEIITIGDEDYPQSLKDIADPPIALYAKGNMGCLKEFCVSIVGSRKASNTGKAMASSLARELSSCGITIVSGFAYGIDIAAHLAALETGSTAAVLGSGLGYIYPKEHYKYIDKVCERGCIITEFFMGERPNPYNFPKRNRIISGLSSAVIVAEASKRSGSLITARLALEQGRDVFAVPASPLSQNNGTNILLKNGAILTESYLDVINEYKENLSAKLKENALSGALKPQEEYLYLWEALKMEAMTIDELVPHLKAPYETLLVSLTMLELEGFIEKGADGRYYGKEN